METHSSLQYSCLENPHGQRSLRAAVHEVAKSWTRLKRRSVHTHMLFFTVAAPVYVPVRRVRTLFLPEVQDILSLPI